MCIYISPPCLYPPLSQAAWGRRWGFSVFLSSKIPSIVPGTQWVLSKFFLSYHLLIWLQRTARIFVCNLYCGTKLIYVFTLCGLFLAVFIKMLSYCTWKTVISIFFFVPSWMTHIPYTRRIWQKGFEKGLDKFMNDKVINVWV